MGFFPRRVARAAAWLAALLLGCAAGPLAAQVTPPPDTTRVEIPPAELPADTFLTAPGDTLAADTVPADSLIPAPSLPEPPPPPAEGWAAGAWVWDREELLRFHGLTLLDLLDRVPGLVITRSGGPGFPVGVSAYGLGGGRLRFFLDGWELDPLAFADFDVQRLALVDLTRVRVERGIAETRVYLDPLRLRTRQARSLVEAGTGDYDTRLLRAYFATPIGDPYALVVAADIVDTDGFRNQPFTSNTLVGRLTRAFGDRTGVEVEYRVSRFDRGGERFPVSVDRRDLVLRGRSRLSDRLFVDALVSRSAEEPRSDSAAAEPVLYQTSARALWATERVWAEGGGRVRFGDSEAFPRASSELFARATLVPVRAMSLSGRVRTASVAGERGAEAEAGVRLALGGGLVAFGQAATGARAVGLPLDTVPGGDFADPEALRSRLGGVRAGAEWSPGTSVLGAAVVATDVASTAPFGLPFEADSLAPESARTTGVEAYASLGVPRLPVRLVGSYLRWQDIEDRFLLPVDQGRASLVYHDVFYGGQLEPDARLDLTYRGAAVAPGADGAPLATERYALLNFALQIRILDVRAFVTFENLFNNRLAADVPGLPLPGTRALYGARWEFRN